MILDILKEVENFPESKIVELGGNIDQKEKIIGEVGLRLRKLWSIISVRSEEVVTKLRILIEIYPNPTLSNLLELAPFIREIERQREIVDALRTIFWIDLREEINTKEPKIGIRVGWKVVSMPSEDDSDSSSPIMIMMDNCGNSKKRPN